MIAAGKLGVDWDWYRDYDWGDDLTSLMKNGTGRVYLEGIQRWGRGMFDMHLIASLTSGLNIATVT